MRELEMLRGRGCVRLLCSLSRAVLPYARGRFNNAVVDLEKCSVSPVEFRGLLAASVSHWREKSMPAAWLKVPIEQSGFISDAASLGFCYHHAVDNHAMLVQWLQEGKTRIADYASHQVGVCGVVLKEDTQEILVTKDRHKISKWKFPGGLSDYAEDIADTAVREVREETGIKTEFRSLLAIRQQHHQPHAFDCSDLYFVCRLSPLSFAISPCEHEILECCWMNIDYLATSKEATLLTERVTGLLLHGLKHGFESIDLQMDELPAVYDGLTYKLFSRNVEYQQYMNKTLG